MKKITIYFNDTKDHYTANIVDAKAGDGLVMLQRGDGSNLDNTMIPIHRIRWIDIVDAEEEKDDPRYPCNHGWKLVKREDGIPMYTKGDWAIYLSKGNWKVRHYIAGDAAEGGWFTSYKEEFATFEDAEQAIEEHKQCKITLKPETDMQAQAMAKPDYTGPQQTNKFLSYKTSEVKHGTHLKELSKGEHRVGIAFNPSNDATIDVIKRLAADLIDKIDGIPLPEMDREGEDEVFRLKAKAQTDVEEAAMWAVKAVVRSRRSS